MSIWDQWAAIPGFDRVQATGAYLTATPQFQQHIHDILFNSGIDPSSDQLGLANSPIEKNANSVVARLQLGQQNSNHNTINAANAAGLEESGAAAAGLNANTEAYKRSYADEASRVAAQISGELGAYTGTVNNIFSGLENAPVPEATSTPVTGSIGGSAGYPMPGGSEADRPGGPAANPNPWHIPTATGAAQSVIKKLKPPVLGGIGHVT